MKSHLHCLLPSHLIQIAVRSHFGVLRFDLSQLLVHFLELGESLVRLLVLQVLQFRFRIVRGFAHSCAFGGFILRHGPLPVGGVLGDEDPLIAHFWSNVCDVPGRRRHLLDLGLRLVSFADLDTVVPTRIDDTCLVTCFSNLPLFGSVLETS